MRIRKYRPEFLFAILGVLVAAPGRSDFNPPVISVNEASTEREVHADVGWTDPIHGHMTDEDEHVGGKGEGPWLSRTVTAIGPGATASASQKSYIDRFSIHGEAHTELLLSANQHGSAHSTIFVTLTLPVETSFALRATFDFSGDAGFGLSDYTGQVAFPTLPPGPGACGGITSTVFEDPDTWEINCIGSASSLTFFLVVATARGDGTAGQTQASVEFDLNFGDGDHDGLLDIWEEEGIDLGEHGSIPLHNMGSAADTADPDIKDIYVEVDSLSGTPYRQGDVDQMIQVFAAAPVPGSDALPGDQGIRLHLIQDQTGIPHPPMQGSTTEVFAEVESVRDSYFGSPGDSEELRFAKQFVFRYALMTDHYSDEHGPAFGIGNGTTTAGDAFFVAAGNVLSVATQPNTNCDNAPCWVGYEESLSGIFMHELGHTLGLQHGGQDEELVKPNYLSAMNEVYAVPWGGTTDQGTANAQYWKLTYSLNALATLDEGDLAEDAGLVDPSGRVIRFSGPPTGCVGTACWHWTAADGSPIDWDRDGMIESSSDADINQYHPADLPAYSVLVGNTDWDQLHYAPRLWIEAPGAFSAISSPEVEDVLPDEISLAEVEAIQSGDWFDLTDVVDADLSVTKSNGVTTVIAGAMTTYTVTVDNTGPNGVVGATVKDFPPAGLDCSWKCTPANGAVCNPGPVASDLIDTADLPLGATATYTVDCQVDPGAIGPISNLARVIPPPSVADLNPFDNEAVDTDDVDGSCGHPNGVVLDHTIVDSTLEVNACSVVILGDQLEVVAPGQLIVGTAGRVEIHSGFSVGAGAEVRVGGISPP